MGSVNGSDMKKLVVLLFAACLFACDSPNQSSERGAGTELEDRAPAEPEGESSAADTTAADDGMQGRTQDESEHKDF